jgi:hypothetical protein
MATNIESLPVGIYMQSGSGAPTHISPKGTEYTDLDTAIVYINKDGVATWVEFLDSTFVFTGGTVSGATFFSGGLSATTFSATTYYNLPTDVRVTGGTYSTGTATFRNNTGGTFSVSGFATSSGFIPYTGATTNVDLGVYGLKADYLSLNTATTVTPTTGQINWGVIDGTYDMGLYNGVTLQVGQEEHMYGKAISAISEGDVVMFAGSQGDHVLFTRAEQNVINNGKQQYIIGVATQNFTTNQFGYVTTIGKVRELNTIAYSGGTILYFNSTGTTAGTLTNVEPTAPYANVQMAAVLRSHATQGILLVRPTFRFPFKSLEDVQITNVQNNDIVQYSSALGYYVNTNTPSFSSISATTIYSPTLDDYLYDKFMTNQYAYFLPSDGTTTYSGLRTAGGTILSTGTIASLVENPMGILFTTPIAVGSVAAQYGTVFGISSLGLNFQFETIRKFRINTNNGAQRLFVGISSLYSTSAPTNVDPLTLINSIGVAKLQSGGTLNFVWNDATGTASYLDLGPNFLGTATTVTYKLKISKTFGVAAINLELTRITNSTGAVLVTGTTITGDYNTGVSYYPVAWMGNNTGVSGAVSFKDYGCQLLKRNAISS